MSDTSPSRTIFYTILQYNSKKNHIEYSYEKHWIQPLSWMISVA